MEDLQTECLIGTSQLYLQPLAYLVEIKEQLSVTDHTGQDIGIINLEVIPCNEYGNEYEEQDDAYVDSPQELLGRPLCFLVKIIGCRGLPAKYTVSVFHSELVIFLTIIFGLILPTQDIYVKFCMFVDEHYTITEKVTVSINPNFNFKKLFKFSHVTQPLIEYLKDGILNIEIWGRQLLKSGYSIPKNFNSDKECNKQMLQEELAKHEMELMNGFKMNGRVIDPNKQSVIVELLLMKKQQARMHQRIVMTNVLFTN